MREGDVLIPKSGIRVARADDDTYHEGEINTRGLLGRELKCDGKTMIVRGQLKCRCHLSVEYRCWTRSGTREASTINVLRGEPLPFRLEVCHSNARARVNGKSVSIGKLSFSFWKGATVPVTLSRTDFSRGDCVTHEGKKTTCIVLNNENNRLIVLLPSGEHVACTFKDVYVQKQLCALHTVIELVRVDSRGHVFDLNGKKRD